MKRTKQMQIIQIPCRQDNYAVLIHDDKTNQTILFDAPEHDAIAEVLETNGWQLDHMLITHYHFDHIEGAASLKAQFGGQVYGPKINAHELKCLDNPIDESHSLNLLGMDIKIFDTPGHKDDHICFYLADLKIAIVADVIFSMGCGRILDGNAAQMYQSIQKLLTLPVDTLFYCGHEYTTANGEFAISVEPNNIDLQTRVAEVKTLRAQSKPTVPTLLSDELKVNPFLRPNSSEIRKKLNMQSASDKAVFAKIRTLKDNF
ncbi:MAG: hydroxyacylglutathione hydrolase [Alphaproteobacteria bacterium]|nr:hydroxyacylglutathione hydrolase [Alphaproteobacteria bacterium]